MCRFVSPSSLSGFPLLPLCLPPLEANRGQVCCCDKCDVDTVGARGEKFKRENVCTFIDCGFLIEGEGLNVDLLRYMNHIGHNLYSLYVNVALQ